MNLKERADKLLKSSTISSDQLTRLTREEYISIRLFLNMRYGRRIKVVRMGKVTGPGPAHYPAGYDEYSIMDHDFMAFEISGPGSLFDYSALGNVMLVCTERFGQPTYYTMFAMHDSIHPDYVPPVLIDMIRSM